jgi:hypothetical protein
MVTRLAPALLLCALSASVFATNKQASDLVRRLQARRDEIRELL